MQIDSPSSSFPIKQDHLLARAPMHGRIAKTYWSLRNHPMLNKYLIFAFFDQPKVPLNANAGDI